jgi:hypothetical protein
MKVLKPLILLTVLLVFTACDDDWTMDLEPPYGGYIWWVANGWNGNGSIEKLNPENFSWEEGRYTTPFPGGSPEYPCGHNYDAAAGDGKVWVGGEIYDSGDQSYYFRIWEVGTPGYEAFAAPRATGLAYDGESLWILTGPSLYTVNPDTHAYDLIYKYDWDPNQHVTGLAWDGKYLWALTTNEEWWYGPWLDDDLEKNTLTRYDPETGEILYSMECPVKNARGLTWDGEALWINDTKTNRLYRVSPRDGNILGYVQMESEDSKSYPWGLAWEFPDGTGN